jgi:hypothetical protein
MPAEVRLTVLPGATPIEATGTAEATGTTGATGATGATREPQTTQPDLGSLKQQHEYVDVNLRSTEDVDYYMTMRKNASLLLTLKKELEDRDRLDDFDMVGRRVCPMFAEKYPQFFNYIKKCEKHRVNEFRNVMEQMFTNLCQVAQGAQTHTEMREQFFEQDLARRYYTHGAIPRGN